MAKKVKVAELSELVALLNLEAIRFFGLSAEVNEQQSEEKSSDAVDTAFGARIRMDKKSFGVRLRAELNAHEGRIVVDVAAEYVSEHEFEVPIGIAFEYVNEVAVMQLLPFVREAALNLSVKVLDTKIVLPVTERGYIAFAPGDEPSQTASLPK